MRERETETERERQREREGERWERLRKKKQIKSESLWFYLTWLAGLRHLSVVLLGVTATGALNTDQSFLTGNSAFLSEAGHC